MKLWMPRRGTYVLLVAALLSASPASAFQHEPVVITDRDVAAEMRVHPLQTPVTLTLSAACGFLIGGIIGNMFHKNERDIGHGRNLVSGGTVGAYLFPIFLMGELFGNEWREAKERLFRRYDVRYPGREVVDRTTGRLHYYLTAGSVHSFSGDVDSSPAFSIGFDKCWTTAGDFLLIGSVRYSRRSFDQYNVINSNPYWSQTPPRDLRYDVDFIDVSILPRIAHVRRGAFGLHVLAGPSFSVPVWVRNEYSGKAYETGPEYPVTMFALNMRIEYKRWLYELRSSLPVTDAFYIREGDSYHFIPTVCLNVGVRMF